MAKTKTKTKKIVDDITEKDYEEALNVKEEQVIEVDNSIALKFELARLEKLASNLAELGIGIPSKIDVNMREIKKLL